MKFPVETIPTVVVPPRRWSWRRLGVVVVLLAMGLVASGFMADFTYWRAHVCLEQRNHQGSLSWLQWATWLRPDTAELHYLLAKTNRRLERFAEVQQHLQRASELGWSRNDLERETWISQAQTGQFAEMQDHWSELFLNAKSDGPEICRAYVISALKQFRVADAQQVVAGWKADFPRDAEPYFQAARIAGVALRWQDAERAYRHALERAPERNDIRAGLVEACSKQLKFAEADQELRKLLQREPDNLAAQTQRAECLVRLGSLETARALVKSVLERQPDDYAALLLLGQIEVGADRPGEAVEAFGRAVALRSEDAEGRYLYAKGLRAAGRDTEAVAHFQFRESARDPLLRLSKATHELVAAPGNLALRYEVGELTWRWKSHAEGAVWLLSLLEMDPHHRPTHALLAKHYERVGDREKSARHRQLAGTSEYVE